ncbi:hypothetical protein HPY42_01150 [Coprothermobacteraceae bacterium]|nr:hypothetical protein [Coprothermobacteraceae bacterium]
MIGKLRGMTLVETLIAMLLLGTILGVVLFGSTYLLVWIQNRLVNMPNYVLGMGRLYNAVYLNTRDITRSATFTLEGEQSTTVTYWLKESWGEMVPTTIDYEQLVGAGTLGGTLTASTNPTVSVQRPRNNNYLLAVYLRIQQGSRPFDNTVVIKKLVNAAPVMEEEYRPATPSQTMTFKLKYPAVGFGKKLDEYTTDPQPTISFTSTLAYVPATISLDDPESICDTKNRCVTAYWSLKVQVTGTVDNTMYVMLPEMVGLDNTPVPSSLVKVGP